MAVAPSQSVLRQCEANAFVPPAASGTPFLRGSLWISPVPGMCLVSIGKCWRIATHFCPPFHGEDTSARAQLRPWLGSKKRLLKVPIQLDVCGISSAPKTRRYAEFIFVEPPPFIPTVGWRPKWHRIPTPNPAQSRPIWLRSKEIWSYLVLFGPIWSTSEVVTKPPASPDVRP